MAFTKVVGPGIHSASNVHTHNINSAGIITATKFVGPFDNIVIGGGGLNISGVVTSTGLDVNGNGDISGNLVVGGNLTANGDFTTLNTTLREVELLRVDANADVAAGIITQTGAGHGLVLADDTTLKMAMNVGSGIATFRALNAGYGNHNGASGIFQQVDLNTAGVTFGNQISVNGATIAIGGNSHRIRSAANDFAIEHTTSSYKGFRFLGNVPENTLVVSNLNSGSVGIGSEIPTAKLDVNGHTELDNVNIAGVSTFTGNVYIADSIVHSGDPNTYLQFPTGDAFNITTGGTQRFGISGTTGMIAIGDNTNLDSSVTITQAQGDCLRIRSNASSNTFKYGVIKLDPYNNNALGVQIVGAKSDSGYTEVDIGGGIEGGYAATQLYFWTAADTTTANGTLRWKIDSSGHLLPGAVGSYNIGSATAEIGDVYVADDKSVYLGNGQDVRIYYDTSGSTAFTIDSQAGYTYINADALRLNSKTSSWNYLRGDKSDGVVKLYKSNSERLATSDAGITVTGEVAASQDYPTTRPTLDFNFAAEKKLDPRITFYRTAIGSYIDENGDYRWASANQPKFNHDEVTHESKGLLIEPARTNKLSSGNNIPSGSNSGGSPGPSLVANDVEAPDGSFTARTIDYSNASGNMNSANAEFSWGDSAPAGKTYSASIWVKGTQGHTINFYLDASGQGTSDTGKVHTTLTGKWQRISVYHTYPSGSNTAYLRCGTRSLHGLTQGTATVVSLWGTTVVEESQPGSTIATPIVSVTTAPDYALIDGEDFTEFFNQVEGTIITSTETLNISGTQKPAVIEGDVTNNERHLLNEASQYQYQIVDGGSTTAQIDAGQMTLSKNIIAAAYKLNDAAVSFNGSDASTDTSVTLPTCTKLKLGHWSTTTYFGHISRFMYYRNRIPNSQLKTLSSQ